MVNTENKHALLATIRTLGLINPMKERLGVYLGRENVVDFPSSQKILEKFEFRPLQGVVLLGVFDSPYLGLTQEMYEEMTNWRAGVVNTLIHIAHLAPARVVHSGVLGNEAYDIWNAVNGRTAKGIKFMAFSQDPVLPYTSATFVRTMADFLQGK
jgi:hypothetical protein